MQGGFYLCGGEDEDLGGGDGVEPAFYPAPDCGEEGGGSYDLLCVSPSPKVRKRSLNTGAGDVQKSYLKSPDNAP